MIPELPLTRQRALALACLSAALLSACGGGGGSSTASAPDVTVTPSVAVGKRWVTSAAQVDLSGGADSGIDGPLVAIDPDRPDTVAALNPDRVDSTSVRIVGGVLDTTTFTLDQPLPRFVVYDAPVAAGAQQSFALYKLALGAAGSAAPVAQRLSSQVTMCAGGGARFTVVGQSLAGDEALITFAAPDGAGSCANGGEPRLVKLGMSSTDAPLALPVAASERLTPVSVIHGSSGQIAAVLAWQNGRFVRTDASMANPVPFAAGEVAGTVDAGSAPVAPGIVTRYGIFIKSADGLRRYDKATGRISAVLVTGQVGQGAQINEMVDDEALTITRVQPDGSIDLMRIDDTAAPLVRKLNPTPLDPWGFRVLKSVVLYAVAGRNDFTVWRKADAQRSNVLDGRVVVMSSTLSDRVLHSGTDASGVTTTSVSLYDGSASRSLGAAQVLSGAMAPKAPAHARTVRGSGAFSQALVVTPAAGQAGLAGAAVKWVSFDAATVDVDAGSLPTTLALGDTPQAPGIVGTSALFAVPKAGTAESYVFVTQRSGGAVARVANGVQ